MQSRDDRYDAAQATKNAGRLAEAAAEMESVVADHPDFALAHSALAAWCTRLDRHEDAIRHARRVCELEPKDAFSYTALSVACMRGGRIQEAEDALAMSRTLQGYFLGTISWASFAAGCDQTAFIGRTSRS